jgi:hypothetical protein
MNSQAETTSALRSAKRKWGKLASESVKELRQLVQAHGFSIELGHILIIDGHFYITHAGLLHVARRKHCNGITVAPVLRLCDSTRNRWTFRAVAYTARDSKGFVGYGDADPSNVSAIVRGAEMRVAETRAVNRALRKAYGIGICSVEELGASPGNRPARAERKGPCPAEPAHGNNGHHPLRERLCSLIDEHELDAVLVKRFAADYCGAPELRLAAREKVEEFVRHLAECAATDRDSLLAQLNGYAEKQAGAA